MTDPRRDLADAAYDVADKYRAGELSHLERARWPLTWHNLVEELKKRQPGFTDDEYAAALDRGFVESR